MRSENSGLIDLDALIKEAASSGELPPSPDDSLRAVSTPDTPRAPPPPPPPAPSPPRPPARRKRSIAPFVAVLAAIGAAVFVAFIVRRSPTPPAPSIATVAAPPTASPVMPAAPIAEPKTEHGVSLSDLPAPNASAAPIIKAAAAVAPSATIVALPDAPPPASNDLGGAMREAVGPLASANIVAPEEGPGGSARQLKPSPGAVIGAINAVLPAARACLDEDDPARNATITFKSDGKVAHVDLAGTERPKDECIKTALTKARTMPFVEDTFAARATVRP